LLDWTFNTLCNTYINLTILMSEHSEIIRHTQNWIEQVVVKHNFCPFAAKVVTQKSMHFLVVETGKVAEALEELMRLVFDLDKDDNKETAFLIFTTAFTDFKAYLDFLFFAKKLLVDQGYEGVYQIASFHPKYQFADSDETDPANYTNRSPYPMIQLLREDSVTKALEHFKNPELIPTRNIELAESLGLEKMKKMWKSVFK